MAETLFDRMLEEGGESWINVMLDGASISVSAHHTISLSPPHPTLLLRKSGVTRETRQVLLICRPFSAASIVTEGKLHTPLQYHLTSSVLREQMSKGQEPRWEIPAEGTLEFDYVTWKRGLEATFKLDLSNPCELFMAEQAPPAPLPSPRSPSPNCPSS